MKVGLLVYKGEHLDFSQTGSSFYRYVHELYTRLRRNRRGVQVDAIEGHTPHVGRGLSMMLSNSFRDLSGYDVLHNLDLAPVFPKRRRSVFISTAHDFQFVIEKKINRSLMTRAKDMIWLQMIVRMSLKSMLQSDYLIAVSSLTKADAVKLGYDSKRIFVVNHGVDDRFMSAVGKKKIDRGQFKVGSIGMFAPRKNIPFAIRAFKQIEDRRISFEVWGKKSYDYRDVEHLAAADRRISFMGFAPDDRIVDIYDSFDAFVFQSLYEGFGIPIIEAQARGLPVITYKYAKLPKEIRKHCIGAEDEEHMAQIIQDLKENGYNEGKRRRAMAYARSFTWDKCAKNTMDVYFNTAGKGAQE